MFRMARVYARRLIPYLLVIILFILLSWFFSFQLEEDAAQKRQISYLRNRVAELKSKVREYEQDETPRESKQGAYSFAEAESRRFYDKPQLGANHGIDRCNFASKHLKSSAELQTVELYGNISFKNENGGVWKQGFDIKYTDSSDFTPSRPLEVFVVPHSHNDPGWIKTYEQYFADQTKNILNNIVEKLEVDVKRKFIWAEISYFSMWWKQASQSLRDRMLKLIKNGQVELVTGGWVMEDEANTHVYAMVDQMIEGNNWIMDHLGIKSSTAWSIDPFGQSPTVAYLRKRMGFTDMLIQRTHYEVKKVLSQQKKLEFMWKQNWESEDGKNDIFCHMMPFYSYDIPHTCGPDPKICCQFDFARLPPTKYSCPWKVAPTLITDGTVAKRAEVLVDQYKKKASLFRSNVLLIPLGDDFRYDNPGEFDKQFTNYEKLFLYINSNKGLNVNIRWGVLSDYFKKVHERMENSQFPKLSGDFYTYADRDSHYWSGYYTSRPFYKKLDRVLESRLRSAEVLFSLANFLPSPHNAAIDLWKASDSGLLGKLTAARRNLGLFQHHDGITGTAKDPVVIDYGRKLLQAIQNADEVIAASAEYLLLSSEPPSTSKPSSFNALILDEARKSHDSLPEGFVIPVRSLATGALYPLVFYNSLGFQRQQVVSVLVDSPNVKILCHTGSIIESQITPKWSSIEPTSPIAFQSNVYELWFRINIHPLSLSRYFLLPLHTSDVTGAATRSTLFTLRTEKNVDMNFEAHGFTIQPVDPKEFQLSNYQYILHFGDNGLLTGITDRNTLERSKVMLNFVTYGTSSAKDKSGAYLFLPDGPAKSVPSLSPTVVVEKGPVMSRVTVQLQNVIHTVRLFNSPGIDGHAISISNLVDIRILSNRELAMRVDGTELMRKPDGSLKHTFYTDLNGFQMQARHFYSKLPLQANFYPMPTKMVIDSPKGTSRLTLHSAQSLGTGMTSSGEVDIILDRRLMQDDNRGLFQGVKDNKVTPNDFWLVLEKFADSFNPSTKDASDYTLYPTVLSQHANLALNSPMLTLLPKSVWTGISEKDVAGMVGYKSQSSGYLPCDVNVLSFRTMKLESKQALLILHRQGHSCKPSSFGELSPTNCSLANGHINLKSVFHSKNSLQFTEYSLNGITPLNSEISESSVNLDSCQINTYQVKLN